MSILTDTDAEKVVLSILERHGAPNGMPEEEIAKALSKFSEFVMYAGLVELFHDGKVAVGWNVGLQDLTWALT